MIPEVRYGPWQTWGRPFRWMDVEAPSTACWRALTCVGCGATLLRQVTEEPVGPDEKSWYPYPLETRLRQEISIPFGVNPQGWPIFGRPRRAMHGKRPRGVRRRYDEVELGGRAANGRQPWPPPGAAGGMAAVWPDLLRLMRRRRIGLRRHRLPPWASHDFGPANQSIWFSVDAPLPCEVRCHNCGRAHTVRGQGPEGMPPADLPVPRAAR